MEPIELIPAGMSTPAGVARVNRAVEAQRNAITDAANALSELLSALDGVSLPSRVCDALDDARGAHTRRRASDEEFLRALAGHPPRS